MAWSQGGGGAGLADRLQRGGDVCPVLTHHRRLLAHPEHLGGLAGIGELAQHAVIRPDRLRLGPRAAIAADADDTVVPFAQHRSRPQQRAVPDALPLDLRVQGESALAAAHREAEVDGVAEIIPAETEPQGH